MQSLKILVAASSTPQTPNRCIYVINLKTQVAHPPSRVTTTPNLEATETQLTPCNLSNSTR